jgi:hypothetical protein
MAMPGQGAWFPETTLNDPRPSAHESSGLRTIQSPPLPPAVIRDEYPAMLVLKNGSMRSVVKYEVTDNTLYFVTPQGENLQVPADLLDHIYPAVRQGAPTSGK